VKSATKPKGAEARNRTLHEAGENRKLDPHVIKLEGQLGWKLSQLELLNLGGNRLHHERRLTEPPCRPQWWRWGQTP